MNEPIRVDGIAGLQALVGKSLGPTEWRVVTQEMIDAFARLSGDQQWIHVDVERAKKESPYGGTIAHGNLTLSLIDGFRDALMVRSGFALGVNYGWNKVRFPAPVPAGSKIRARVEVVSIEDVGDSSPSGGERGDSSPSGGERGHWWQVVHRWTIEREGADKPACVADSVGRVLERR